MHDLSCVIHVHSRHSDGTGSVPEIARAAQRAGADVVIVTDHDSLGAARAGEEGWYGSTLLLAGHEVTPPGRNHLLAFGTREVIDHEGRTPAETVQAVRRDGGLPVAAHPFSRGSRRFRFGSFGSSMLWEDPDCVDGLEVWSYLSDLGQALGSLREALAFVARPERRVSGPPRRNLDEWDRQCARRRTVGIAGLDAHQFGLRVGPVVVRAFGYRRSFRQLRTHVLVPEPPAGDLDHDRELVFAALAEGRCYMAASFVAAAGGFRFLARGDGDERVEMGSEARAGAWRLEVRLPQRARVRLLRDGREVASAEGTGLAHRAEGPGAYRVEAQREHLGAVRTWILSNPVYLR